MKMRNEFEEMCKKLNNCKKGCVCNQYICAEKAVKEYVGEDRKKLLQLKAQAESGDYYSYGGFGLALTALVVSCLDAFF